MTNLKYALLIDSVFNLAFSDFPWYLNVRIASNACLASASVENDTNLVIHWNNNYNNNNNNKKKKCNERMKWNGMDCSIKKQNVINNYKDTTSL